MSNLQDSIDGFQISPANDRAPDLNLPFNGVPGPSCPPSVLQETVCAYSEIWQCLYISILISIFFFGVLCMEVYIKGKY